MKKISTIFIISLFTLSATAGQPNQLVVAYIDAYKEIAIREMIDYKIPASITLAQGILESGAGQSELAKESNNHFGIKCHTDWKGDKVYYDDDAKDECFRKYDHVEDSYEDHSIFLSTKPRYAFLFELDADDYKGWAKGLKEAGYATNPKYADLLINTIEEYDLHQYDKMTMADIKSHKHDQKKEPEKEKEGDHTKENNADTKEDKNFNWGGYASNVFYFNRIPTITVRENDTPESIAKENNAREQRLYTYNDLKPGDKLQAGTKFYLQPKRKKGTTKYHVVKENETMWSISRDEGVRLDKLYQYNLLSPGQEPAKGEEINLRHKRKEMPKLQKASNKTQQTKEIKKEEPVKQKEAPVEKIKEEEKQDSDYIIFDEEELIDQGQKMETPDAKIDPVVKEEVKAPDAVNTIPEQTIEKQALYHVVIPKETLYSLSKQYGVTVDQIMQWNNLPDAGIKIGQRLIVGYQ